jgi:hypothetical protein
LRPRLQLTSIKVAHCSWVHHEEVILFKAISLHGFSRVQYINDKDKQHLSLRPRKSDSVKERVEPFQPIRRRRLDNVTEDLATCS